MKELFKNYTKCGELSSTKMAVMIEENSLPINTEMAIYQIAWEAESSPSKIRKSIGKSERVVSERFMEHINQKKGAVGTLYVSVLKKCSSKAELSFYEGLYIHASAKRILRSAYHKDVPFTAKTKKTLAKYMTNELLVE